MIQIIILILVALLAGCASPKPVVKGVAVDCGCAALKPIKWSVDTPVPVVDQIRRHNAALARLRRRK